MAFIQPRIAISLRAGRVRWGAIVAVAMLPLASCSRGPAAVRPPEIDPADAGSQALELYDTDADGVIAGEELDKAPGLKAALARVDTSGDGGASADEIAARIAKWQETRAGLMAFSYQVTLDGAPLGGARVTFEPESFLGEAILPAEGETSDFGTGGASIAKDKRPSPTSPPGMHLGMYRVRITKNAGGKELVPARYNEQTILGQEVAYDVSEIANNRVVYALKSQ
jgi:hypothetical protein